MKELQKQTMPKRREFKLRYYCDACTGRAFYCEDHEFWEGKRICQNCGMPVVYNANNYFVLSDDENQKVNQ